jgi:hypothetical protein
MDSSGNTIADVVICLGPNDIPLFGNLIQSIINNVLNINTIYIITKISPNLPVHTKVVYIDETIFPFTMQYIHDAFNTHHRSGWYLQQLLKIYACKYIPQMNDNFIIIDADVIFHKPVAFFKENKLLFNVGKEHHIPYFDHMKKMHPSLYRVLNCSGICHLMPMKRQIVNEFISMIERHHNKEFWKLFLEFVEPVEYAWSGASEYEMLFNYTILYHQDLYEIRPLLWKNTQSYTPNYEGTYEACHHYMRTV